MTADQRATCDHKVLRKTVISDYACDECGHVFDMRVTPETAAVRCRQCSFEDQAVDNAPGGFHEPGCPRAPSETPEASGPERCKLCGWDHNVGNPCPPVGHGRSRHG